ncbi:hypothetical protein HY605_05730 [Candidatus Peregrinibacteria bacterium]|nr:hypothetical protein [Candidatus Peregrinibacteria bacterium]
MKKEERKNGKIRKEYTKPEISSQLYQERHALACNKMSGTTSRCNRSSDVS